eukprot:2632844-Pleurochrysis_carterae.AAC.1
MRISASRQNGHWRGAIASEAACRCNSMHAAKARKREGSLGARGRVQGCAHAGGGGRDRCRGRES